MIRPDMPPHSDREKKVTTSCKQQVTPAVRRRRMYAKGKSRRGICIVHACETLGPSIVSGPGTLVLGGRRSGRHRERPTACSEPFAKNTFGPRDSSDGQCRIENGQPVIEWRGHFAGMVTNGECDGPERYED